MKHIRRITLLLALAAALAMSLAACADKPAPETVDDPAALVDGGNLTGTQSVDATMTMEMAYDMHMGGTDTSQEGLSMSMLVDAELTMLSDGDVSHVTGPLSINVAGNSSTHEMDAWQVQSDGKTVTYVREGDGWTADDTAGKLVAVPTFTSSMLTDLKVTAEDEMGMYVVTGNLDTSKTDIDSLTGVLSGLGMEDEPIEGTVPVTLDYDMDTKLLKGFHLSLENDAETGVVALRVNYVVNGVNETELQLPEDIPA